jgi:hypothetical protein
MTDSRGRVFPQFLHPPVPPAENKAQRAVITLIYSFFLLTERVRYISINEATGHATRCSGKKPSLLIARNQGNKTTPYFNNPFFRRNHG